MTVARNRWAKVAALAAVWVLAFWTGAVAHSKRWYPVPQIERRLRAAVWLFRSERGFRDTSGRQQVSCGDAGEDTWVWLTLGQSNAGNEAYASLAHGVDGVLNYNFFDGRCYAARDPLLGATADRASVWTRAANTLVAAGDARRIVIASIAVGGSSIDRWTPEGDLFSRIEGAVVGIGEQGLKVTHVLWHQGESDAHGVTSAQYAERFGSMLSGLRGAGVDAPVFAAVASICKNSGSDEIRQAQRGLPLRYPDVFAGPDTDRLDRFRWRKDLCHFNEEGLQLHADAWVEALTSAR